MKADQGELMVDPNGPWWFAVYLVCAVVLGGSLWALHCWSPGLASNPAGGHAAGGGIGLDQGVRMQVC